VNANMTILCYICIIIAANFKIYMFKVYTYLYVHAKSHNFIKIIIFAFWTLGRFILEIFIIKLMQVIIYVQ